MSGIVHFCFVNYIPDFYNLLITINLFGLVRVLSTGSS